MPSYDYLCEMNGRVVEIAHSMNDNISTWGELCTRAGLPLGDTAAETPVRRLISGGNIVSSRSLGSGAAPAPACNSGPCCRGNTCSLH